MLQYAICDDDGKARRDLSDMIRELSGGTDLLVETYESGRRLLQEIEQGRFFDMVFLDIEMGGTDGAANGIDMGIRLRRSYDCTDTLLVFVSAHGEYLLRSFDAQPFDFLCKPVQKDKLRRILERAARNLEQNNRIFRYSVGYEETLHCPIREILWFEISPRHRISIMMKRKKASFRGKLDDVERQLEEMQVRNFLRAQKSFLLNMDYIHKYNSQMIWMAHQDCGVSIGEKYKKDVLGKLSAYFGES